MITDATVAIITAVTCLTVILWYKKNSKPSEILEEQTKPGILVNIEEPNNTERVEIRRNINNEVFDTKYNDIYRKALKDEDYLLANKVKDKINLERNNYKVFTEVFLDERNYRNLRRELNDDNYLLYIRWKQLNNIKLTEKCYPGTTVFAGNRANEEKLIFHGGCLSCTSQKLNGIDTCRGCQYFRANWSLQDLSNEKTNT